MKVSFTKGFVAKQTASKRAAVAAKIETSKFHITSECSVPEDHAMDLSVFIRLLGKVSPEEAFKKAFVDKENV